MLSVKGLEAFPHINESQSSPFIPAAGDRYKLLWFLNQQNSLVPSPPTSKGGLAIAFISCLLKLPSFLLCLTFDCMKLTPSPTLLLVHLVYHLSHCGLSGQEWDTETANTLGAICPNCYLDHLYFYSLISGFYLSLFGDSQQPH